MPSIAGRGKRFGCLTGVNLRLTRIGGASSIGGAKPGAPTQVGVCVGVDWIVLTVDEREGDAVLARGNGVDGRLGRSDWS